MRHYLLFLRYFHAARERYHIRATARAEAARRRTLKQLAMLDAPKPYQPPRYRRLVRLLWS